MKLIKSSYGGTKLLYVDSFVFYDWFYVKYGLCHNICMFISIAVHLLYIFVITAYQSKWYQYLLIVIVFFWYGHNTLLM